MIITGRVPTRLGHSQARLLSLRLLVLRLQPLELLKLVGCILADQTCRRRSASLTTWGVTNLRLSGDHGHGFNFACTVDVLIQQSSDFKSLGLETRSEPEPGVWNPQPEAGKPKCAGEPAFAAKASRSKAGARSAAWRPAAGARGTRSNSARGTAPPSLSQTLRTARSRGLR